MGFLAFSLLCKIFHVPSVCQGRRVIKQLPVPGNTMLDGSLFQLTIVYISVTVLVSYIYILLLFLFYLRGGRGNRLVKTVFLHSL